MMGMIWSDKIDLRDDLGWFGGGEINALFEVNFSSDKYKLITQFEDDKIISGRKYSFCKLYHNKVFCFPVYGDRIWIYNLERKDCSQISIRNPKNVDKLLFSEVFIYNSKIYAFSKGIRAIFEIDPENQEIINTIYIPEKFGIISSNCLQSDNLIYCTFWNSRALYEINVETKKTYMYDIPLDIEGISTIALNGNNEFWFTGFEKAIYVWNKQTNKTKVFVNFPDEFGIYKFIDDNKFTLDCDDFKSEDSIFITSINIGENIWFIPFRTNKIIYINKKTGKINILEISDEEETAESWSRMLNHKYLAEYVREDRFIGLYSLKKKCILEIDTVEFDVKEKIFFLEQESMDEIVKKCKEDGLDTFYERQDIHRNIFANCRLTENKKWESSFSIGRRIYESILRG